MPQRASIRKTCANSTPDLIAFGRAEHARDRALAAHRARRSDTAISAARR